VNTNKLEYNIIFIYSVASTCFVSNRVIYISVLLSNVLIRLFIILCCASYCICECSGVVSSQKKRRVIWLLCNKSDWSQIKTSQSVFLYESHYGRGSHIFWTIGSQMAVRLLALSSGRPLPPGKFLVLISVRVWVDPRAIVWLEESGQLKNTMISSRIETATFRIVA
jgi:hypothetical protein